MLKKLTNTKVNYVSCHRLPERSFFWKGKQFPVCSRCTGIHLGYLSFPLFLFGVIQFSWWTAIILMLPTILDGLTQAYFDRESTNWLRFSTGLIAGIGAMSLVSLIGIQIGLLILKLFN